MDDSIRVFDGLLAVTALLSRDLERETARTGLSQPRMHLVWELGRSGPSTQRSLADALAVSPRNITGLVDALEATGHVRRAPHPTDRRAVLVELTPAGAAVVRSMIEEHRTVARALVAGMPAAEVAALADGLAGLIERLQRLMDGADG